MNLTFVSSPSLHEFAERPFKFLEQFPKNIKQYELVNRFDVSSLEVGVGAAVAGFSAYIMASPVVFAGSIAVAIVAYCSGGCLPKRQETKEYTSTVSKVNNLLNPYITQFRDAYCKKENYIYDKVNDAAVNRLMDVNEQIEEAIAEYEQLKAREANWDVFKQDARAIMSIHVDRSDLHKTVKLKVRELQEAASLFINGLEASQLNKNINYVEYWVSNGRITILKDHGASWN
ncbi:MAG: hypothetical protein ACXU9U_00515 [Parachlamydiaceae bacterium]